MGIVYNKELELQKFLRNPLNSVKDLEVAPYFLNVKRHPKYNNLVQFGYDQIESPKNDPIIVESRGVILDENENWKVVAMAFKRFFNQGEGHAAPIDWSTAKVQEKLDGSLILMYWYKDRWHVATKGSPDAGGNVGLWTMTNKGETVPMTFSRLFWRTADYWLKGLSKTGYFNKNFTYIWELTSPYNRVICDYKYENHADSNSKVTLIGVRDNLSLKEFSVDIYKTDVYNVVQQFPITTLDEVLEASKKLDPINQEGFVVVDDQFNRIKVKSPAYVELHHLRDGSPQRRIMNLIKAGESSEVLSYALLDSFPEEKALFESYTEKLNKIILNAEKLYDTIAHVESQKEFALEAVKCPVGGALFMFRLGKVKSIREAVMNTTTEKLLEMVK